MLLLQKIRTHIFKLYYIHVALILCDDILFLKLHSYILLTPIEWVLCKQLHVTGAVKLFGSVCPNNSCVLFTGTPLLCHGICIWRWLEITAGGLEEVWWANCSILCSWNKFGYRSSYIKKELDTGRKILLFWGAWNHSWRSSRGLMSQLQHFMQLKYLWL